MLICRRKKSKVYCKTKNLEVVLYLRFIMIMGGVINFREKGIFRLDLSKLDFESPFPRLEKKQAVIEMPKLTVGCLLS